MAENGDSLVDLKGGSNMRTLTLGASHDSSHSFRLWESNSKIISTPLPFSPSANLHILLQKFGSDWQPSKFVGETSLNQMCAFSRRWALARRAASGRLTLISPNNTSIDSSGGTIDRAQAFLRLKWQDNMVLWKASGVRVVNRWACPH